MIPIGEFETKYYGQHVPNNHGGYPGECVSLAARWAQEGQGVTDGDSALYCAYTGGARDLFESYGKPGMHIQDFYDKVSAPQTGDYVVWGANMGKYGDIAIYIGSNQVFGQLGTPVFQPAAARELTPTPLGYLRRKGTDMTQDEAYAVVSQIYRVATDCDPDGGQADYWAKRIQTNPATAAELASALGGNDYKGDPQFRYKGRHYSEDMTTAKKQAYDEGLAAGGGTGKVLPAGNYIVKGA